MRFPITLCLLVVLCGCGSRPASVKIDPALATLVPSDTVLMAGIKLESLRATPAYKKFSSPATLLGGTGLELDKTWELLAVSDGRRSAVLARGKFSDSGLEPRLDIPGATRSIYKGYPLTATGSLAVAFLNPSTAVVGRPEAVKAVLDQRGQSNGPPRALQAQLERIGPGNQIWAVGIGSAVLAQAAPSTGNLANLGTVLRLVQSFRMAVEAGAGVQLTATALCRNPSDADSLAGALRFFTALAGLKTGKDVQIDSSGTEVHINALVPPEMLDQLAQR